MDEDVDFDGFLQQLQGQDSASDLDLLLNDIGGDGQLSGELQRLIPDLQLEELLLPGEHDSPSPASPDSSCTAKPSQASRVSEPGAAERGASQVPSECGPACSPGARTREKTPECSSAEHHVARKAHEKAQDHVQRTKERNRIYAARTRQRKNQQAQELRQRCSRLEAENAQLRTRLQLLHDENLRLRASTPLGASAQPAMPCSANSDSTATAQPSTHGAMPVPAPPAACLAPAAGTAQNDCHRASANTYRFTAAAAGVQKPPPPVSAAAVLSSAQRKALMAGSMSSPQPAGAVAESASGGHNNSHQADTTMSVPRSKRSKRRRHEGLAVTLGDISPPRRRGLLPLLATASVLLLCVLACLALSSTLSGTRQTQFSPAAQLPELEPELGFDAASGRSLLADTADASTPGLAPSVEEWSAAARGVQDVMPSAEFVCNRSACFALQPDAHTEARAQRTHPWTLRSASEPGQHQVDTRVMSTLQGLADTLSPGTTPAPPHLTQGAPAQRTPTAKLRGMGQLQQAALPARACDGSGCGDFAQLADNAMFGAGLIAPGTCRLVYDSALAAPAGGHAAGSYVSQWQSARQAHARAARATSSSVPPSQHGDSGFVMVNEGHAAAGAHYADGAHTAVIPADGEALFDSTHQYSGSAEPQGSQDAYDRSANGSEADASVPVVSVMLPVEQDAAREPGVLTPLTHLYVAVVHPEQRLQAYDCELAQRIYA